MSDMWYVIKHENKYYKVDLGSIDKYKASQVVFISDKESEVDNYINEHKLTELEAAADSFVRCALQYCSYTRDRNEGWKGFIAGASWLANKFIVKYADNDKYENIAMAFMDYIKKEIKGCE